MKHLDVVGLYKKFQDHSALNGVCLSADKGELLCLLGPSGCGKTTTLRIIAGFERAESGHVLLDGVDIAPVPAEKREIGFVFQSYALFPHLTVAENVGFGLKMRGVPAGEIAAATAEALRVVQLAGVAGRLPRQLSGGQQQRVALARAIAIKPRLLLLDEPLSNLDAKLRDEMRAELRRIQQSVGITAIFVTHDQQEALALADRVAVMNQGNVLQVAPPADIYEKPAHPFVASFLGRSNLLDGRIVAIHGSEIRVRTSQGRELVGTGQGFSVGDDVVAVIKFERLQVLRISSAQQAVLPGAVSSATYLGTHIEYEITCDGLRLGAIRLNESDDNRFGVGDPVALSVLPQDCHILRRNG